MVHCGCLKIQPILFVFLSHEGTSVLFHLVANMLQRREALRGFPFTDDFIPDDGEGNDSNVMEKQHASHSHPTKTERELRRDPP